LSCYDSRIFKRAKRKSKDKLYDVGFVGNVFKADRLEYLVFLAEKGVKLNVCGLYRNNTWLTYESMIRMFQATKVNLNFTRAEEDKLKILPDNGVNSLYRQLKGRIFEIMMSGGFCLTEYAVPLEELFEIGKELDTFEGKEECLDKVKFYLSREALREKLAEAGMLKARKICDAKAVISKLWKFVLKQYETNRGKSLRYPLPSEFKKRYFAFRMAIVAFPDLWRFPSKLLQEIVIEARHSKFSVIPTIALAIRKKLKVGRASPYKEGLFSRLKEMVTFDTEV